MNIGLIGCGRISVKHIETLVKLYEKANLVAVCDIEEKAVEKAIGSYYAGTKRTCVGYRHINDFLTCGEINLVVIATESGQHFEHAKATLIAGKHVLIEKPIALSTKDADELIQFAAEKGLKIAVSHQNRFNPPVQALRMAIEGEGFGRIINGTARILWNRNQEYYTQAPWRGTWARDGGTLMNQCIHNIDLLQWMLGGEVESVYAQAGTFMRDIEGEDFGAILLRFKSGAIGIVEGSACVYPTNLEETLSIFGETGTAVLGGLAVNRINTWQFKDEGIHSLGVIEEDQIDNVYGHGHLPLYEDFIEAILNNREPLINGVEGSKALRIILAAYQSRKTGLPVKLDDGFEFSTLDMLR